jgi:ribosomal protein L22
MKKFTDKNIFDMTTKERQIDNYSHELNIKYLLNIIQDQKAVKFKNEKDYILFHPCTNKDSKYQITYIWKKDNKPSGDIRLDTLKQVAKELYSFLRFNYKQLKPIKKV